MHAGVEEAESCMEGAGTPWPGAEVGRDRERQRERDRERINHLSPLMFPFSFKGSIAPLRMEIRR
jgi:hypothetical protein